MTRIFHTRSPLQRALASLRSLPRTSSLALGTIAIAGALSTGAQAQTGYSATLGGQLYEIEPATGILSPVLATGVNQLFGIANTATPDVLLLSGVTAGLFLADVGAGTVTPLPAGGAPMFAVCNNEDDGAIYGVSLANLYEIDPVTGATSLIGPTGAINIYGLDYHQGLRTLIGFDPITNQIWSIDPASGAGTPIGPAMAGLVGLWYDASSDTLYGICDGNNAGCISEIDPVTGATSLLFSSGLNLVSIGGDVGGGPPPTIGSNYCTAQPNSTGAAASISADGSRTASDNDLTLTASGMPPTQFGIFLTSMTQASTPVASGTLCVGGNIIRFQGPGQILQADANGEFSLQVDTQALPAGIPTPIVAGDTYNFTAWFRDTDPMTGATANFSDGYEITFQ